MYASRIGARGQDAFVCGILERKACGAYGCFSRETIERSHTKCAGKKRLSKPNDFDTARCIAHARLNEVEVLMRRASLGQLFEDTLNSYLGTFFYFRDWLGIGELLIAAGKMKKEIAECVNAKALERAHNAWMNAGRVFYGGGE